MEFDNTNKKEKHSDKLRKFANLVALAVVLAVIAVGIPSGCGNGGDDIVTWEGPLGGDAAEPTLDGGSTQRLDSDPRRAVAKEACYALTGNADCKGAVALPGAYEYLSNWPYAKTDASAWHWVAGQYGGCTSMWTGGDGDPTSCAKPYKSVGSLCPYHHLDAYSWAYGQSRGGQCRAFANLITYRAGVLQKLHPSYSNAWNDYSTGGRHYTKDARKVQIGDILYSKSLDHAGIVRQILAGQAGVSVTAIDFVDSNLLGGGTDQERIGMHRLTAGDSRRLYNLDAYFALDLLALGGK